MGGFVRGKIECYVNNGNRNVNMQNMFKNLYDFFTSHPQYALIALNYGSSTGPALTNAGTGSEYVDGITAGFSTGAPKSFGNNAFFVVRQNASPVRPYDVFHLFQWSGGTAATRGQAFGSSPGNPGLCCGTANPNSTSTAALAWSCAIGISGSGGSFSGTGIGLYGASSSGSLQNKFGNPWRGGMNALTGVLGIDIKGQSPNPVWGHPPGSGSFATGSGVMIFPRSNNGDTGAHMWSSTLSHFAENTCLLANSINNDTSAERMHIIADDDSFVFWYDIGDVNNNSTIMSYVGPYLVRNNVPSGSQVSITPYCAIVHDASQLPWTVSSVYGDIAGTSLNQGGVISNTTASVRSAILDRVNNFGADVNSQPNYQMSGTYGSRFGSGYFDEFQIPIGVLETTPQSISGYLGQIDFVRWMYNVQTPGVRSDYTRAVFGSATIADHKMSIPWDSQNNTPPRSGIRREGITFIRPPISTP